MPDMCHFCTDVCRCVPDTGTDFRLNVKEKRGRHIWGKKRLIFGSVVVVRTIKMTKVCVCVCV